MLSPEPAIAAMARNCAAWPEETATAAAPPSKAAILFSKTSYFQYCHPEDNERLQRTYHSWIANAGVDMAQSSQPKEVGSMLRWIWDEGTVNLNVELTAESLNTKLVEA